MSALVGYISLLVESIGPGVIMCPSCPGATLYFISAITTSLFSLMHMAWMMISFDGFSDLPKTKGWLKIIWVIVSHYGASFAVSALFFSISYFRQLIFSFCLDNFKCIECELWMCLFHTDLFVYYCCVKLHCCHVT